MKKAFTLVELLITISIIGILSAVIFISFTNSKKKADDAKVTSDVEQIKKALEMYQGDNGHYPRNSTGSEVGLSSIDLSKYISASPRDINRNQDYRYVSYSDSDSRNGYSILLYYKTTNYQGCQDYPGRYSEYCVCREGANISPSWFSDGGTPPPNCR